MSDLMYFVHWCQEAVALRVPPQDQCELIEQAHRDAAFERSMGAPDQRKHKIGFAKPPGKARAAGAGKH